MNRINQLFDTKKKDILSVYFCAGYPRVENTAEVIRTLEAGGVDLIEIGIPFSDPMADGPVIQQAATAALQNGMSLRLLFRQLREIRSEVNIPLILMGYLNPVMQYGFEKFCQDAKACGIDGCILPDLPFEEYCKTYRAIAQRFDFRIILLITPETEEDRIRRIDAETDGFIYMVSSAATTGARERFDAESETYFDRISRMNLKNPCMIGFGISGSETYSTACRYAAGGIIGSKFVALLAETGDAQKALSRLKSAIMPVGVE